MQTSIAMVGPVREVMLNVQLEGQEGGTTQELWAEQVDRLFKAQGQAHVRKQLRNKSVRAVQAATPQTTLAGKKLPFGAYAQQARWQSTLASEACVRSSCSSWICRSSC